MKVEKKAQRAVSFLSCLWVEAGGHSSQGRLQMMGPISPTWLESLALCLAGKELLKYKTAVFSKRKIRKKGEIIIIIKKKTTK